MITDWVDGVQKGQNLDYVIFEWSLIMCFTQTEGYSKCNLADIEVDLLKY